MDPRNAPPHAHSIALYTEVDAQCDKLSKVVSRTSTVAVSISVVPSTQKTRTFLKFKLSYITQVLPMNATFVMNDFIENL